MDEPITQQEPTDEQLRQKIATVRAMSGAPNISQFEPVPALKLSPRQDCIRCHQPLAEGRLIQCAECDLFVSAHVAQLEAEQRAKETEQRLATSGLPVDYRTGKRAWADIRGLFAEESASAFELLREKRERGLYVYGKPGSFKTSATASFLADTIGNGEAGRYVYLQSLLTELYEIYAANDTRSRADVVNRYATTRHLVLDDFGKERPTEHAAAVLMEILDERYRRSAGWTIIVSNYSLTESAKRLSSGAGDMFSGPIMRRIGEMCVTVKM
jgi:DNA replication protein DnaC